MLFDTREEADDFIAQITKNMVVTDTSIIDGVEKTVYSLETNGVEDKNIEVNVAPAGTQFDEEIIEFLKNEEDGVELILGQLDDYTTERIVIVNNMEGSPEPNPLEEDDVTVDSDQLP